MGWQEYQDFLEEKKKRRDLNNRMRRLDELRAMRPLGTARDALYASRNYELESLRQQTESLEREIRKNEDKIERLHLCFVARDEKTPSNFLDKLARDHDSKIRESVAMNKSTSGDTLKELATDADRDVRLAVLFNENASENIIMPLVDDADETISNRAKIRLRIEPDYRELLQKTIEQLDEG